MLTLAKLTVALAGTALLGIVAAAPAPQVTADVAITTSQDALVPIITVTETYTTHGSVTTATITIYEFSKDHADTIAPHTSPTVNNIAGPTILFAITLNEPGPQTSTYGGPSSVVDGMPIYTNIPHHHGHSHSHSHSHGHKPGAPKSITAPGAPHPKIAHSINTEAYSLPTGVLTRLLTTDKPRHKTGKPSVNHYHGVPITEDFAEVMPTVGPEGTSSR